MPNPEDFAYHPPSEDNAYGPPLPSSVAGALDAEAITIGQMRGANELAQERADQIRTGRRRPIVDSGGRV